MEAVLQKEKKNTVLQSRRCPEFILAVKIFAADEKVIKM